MILPTFMEIFIGAFVYCFAMKKTGNVIHSIEILLLLEVMWLEKFCNEESSIPYSPQG